MFLEADRTVELHAQFGSYYKVRIPKFGRDMAYRESTAELFISASGNEVYRLNLDVGRFFNPIATSSPNGVNVCGICPIHELLALGCENGMLECWDPRSRSRTASLDIAKDVLASAGIDSTTRSGLNNAVTALRFDLDGLSLALGTRSGHVLMYDLRSSTPLFVKDHRYDQPIVDIKFHPNRQHIISSDTKVVKIWDRKSVCIHLYPHCVAHTHTHTHALSHTHTHTHMCGCSLWFRYATADCLRQHRAQEQHQRRLLDRRLGPHVHRRRAAQDPGLLPAGAGYRSSLVFVPRQHHRGARERRADLHVRGLQVRHSPGARKVRVAAGRCHCHCQAYDSQRERETD